MKIVRIIIAIYITLTTSLAVMAEGYNVLVLPNSCVDTAHRNLLGDCDIEEMLAKKIIDKLEETDTANAPSVSVLKISILNNPNFSYNTTDPMNNVKAMTTSYGVPKVLLISSKTEMQTPDQQKDFWNKLGLPVLIHPETAVKVTTTVSLMNAKDEQVLYTNVFYKKFNSVNISELNSYYEELIPMILDNMKDSKQTHAIMVGSGVNLEVDDPDKTVKKITTTKIKELKTTEKKTTENTVPKIGFSEKMKAKLNGWNIDNNPNNKSNTKSAKNSIKKEEKKAEQKEVRTKTTENAVGLSDKIKTKYEGYKEKQQIAKTNKLNNREINLRYSTVAVPDNTSSANRYLQTKPRTQSKNFVPRFSNSINDM